MGVKTLPREPDRLLGYYTSYYPQTSTTFISREITALRNKGFNIVTIGSHNPTARSFLPRDNEEHRATVYIRSFPWSYRLKALLQALRCSPVRLLFSCAVLPFHGRFSMSQLWVNTGYLIGGIVLGHFCRTQGIPRLHVHFAFGCASVAWFCKSVWGIPYTLAIHGSDVLFDDPALKPRLFGAEKVISNCRFHVNNLVRRFSSLSASHFIVIRLGINCSMTPWTYRDVSPPFSPLRILFVARLYPVKAPHILINACSLLQQHPVPFECRIVGDGPLFAEVKRRISSAGLSSCVKCLGALPDAHIAAQMAWSHVLVLSSLSEGTPMTIIEAMSIGRAVVAPAITAIPELVHPKKNGLLFTRGSARGLADALIHLAGDPDTIREWGKRGRTFVCRHHNGDQTASDLAMFFSTLGNQYTQARG